jgi:hypothetical protein
MKKKFNNYIVILLYLLLSGTFSNVVAEEISFYFDGDARFNPLIPSPEEFMGYQTGTQLMHHHEIVSYFKELDRLSERTSLQVIGKTYEGKPLLALIVSSAHNLANLEQIRLDHLKVLDPQSNFDHSTLPVLSFLAYSVHGNENSAAEAAVLTAYYLVASEDPKIKNYMDEAIYFIKPVRNPDGHDRHAHWVNTQKSKNLVADPADLEHNEAYPGGRGNHYWFDLNRDWIPAIHPESKARLTFYHSWLPHVATCHHEMGTNNTFFFEPTQPIDRESPIVPQSHYALNYAFANYYAEALDQIGELYFTKEVFDNFNPTFGSSYPDYNGTIAILLEQGSSRGIVQERTVGVITFPEAIRNQLVISIATIKASVDLKPDLLANQKDFFRTAFEKGAKNTTKGYIFGDAEDQTRTFQFARLLQKHRIEVLENDREITIGSQIFKPGSSFLVPVEQAQYRMVELFFNPGLSVPDSIFYDGSTWTVALAYGLPYASLNSKSIFTGKSSFEDKPNKYGDFHQSEYAYLVRWTDYNAPAFLNSIFRDDVVVYTAFKPFSTLTGDKEAKFRAGTLVIPVKGQSKTSDQLHSVLANAGLTYNIEVHPVHTGYNTQGIDLGSRNIKPLHKPEILILTGRGISWLETGQAWYLIDNHLDIAVTRADIAGLGRLNLKRYNTIIIPSVDNRFGGLQIDNHALQQLKNWIAGGGTLIALNRSSEWVIQNELVDEALINIPTDTTRTLRYDFGNRAQVEGAKIVGGTILNLDVDTTHPLGFGLTSRNLPILKNNTMALKYSAYPYHTAAAFGNEPLLSGFISGENLSRFTHSAGIIVSPVRSGRVILFAFDPIHRASWFSSARLFYNAIHFGSLTAP